MLFILDIPISAQVVSVADVYDALTSDRVYKRAFSHEKAMQMILDESADSSILFSYSVWSIYRTG